MKWLDQKTQHKLIWFIVPMMLVSIMVMLDITFGVDLNVGEWAPEALLACMAIFILAYIVAAWRQQCWGLLAIMIFAFVLGALNIGSLFYQISNSATP
jgi:cell division protein FtsW (lipid II flippase)